MSRRVHNPRRGQDFFWKVIRELDACGPWSVLDINARSSATKTSKASVRDFVRRLQLAGWVEQVGERPTRTSPSPLYRLRRDQVETPRLRRDGTPLPEPATATLWRTMKMLQTFTASDLAALATTPERRIGRVTATSYLKRLHAAGVVACIQPGGARKEARYRLVRNTGAKAPQILRGLKVWDPNTNELIADLGEEEVSP